MHTLVVTLRLIHVIGGTMWVGALIFNALFLAPAVRDAGPAGGAVMGQLMKRKLPVIMPLVGLAAVISGIWLYYINSVGFQTAYMKSGHGMMFGIGGVFGIVALILAGAVLAPTMQKAVALSQQAQAPGADKDALLAQAQALRVRVGKLGAVNALLGVIAAGAMAVARYM